MRKILMTAVAVFAAAAFSQERPDAGKKKAPMDAQQIEARAGRMIKNALSLIESGEDERAVSMLEAVPRMYPESAARFKAALELGRHFLDKRVFDRSAQELRTAQKSSDNNLVAEALLLQGKLHLARGESGEAVMALRRLTQDFPTSAFANDAFFLIGQIHFEAGRWTKASEAFAMVGTAVPEDDSSTNATVLAEAGQRIFVHVNDKDLAVLVTAGEKGFVELEGSDGDSEKSQLIPFGRGDGDFLASVETTTEPTKPNDGKLTVRGSNPIKVLYVDANDEKGSSDIHRDADAKVVSSGSITFMDGAQRQKVSGVFVNQPAFLRLRDLDLDVSDKPDTATVVVKSLYRERPEIPPGETVAPPPAPDAPWLTRGEISVTLTETGNRTGIFTGRIVTRLLKEGETNAPALPAGEIGVLPEEKVRAEYTDKRHLRGDKPEIRSAEAYALVGGSTEPQSIVAHASEATVQAKKLLLEAQLLCKWGNIFKDTGLMANAKAKADEGLDRVAEILQIAKRHSLDRAVVEQSYEVKWSLYLVKDALADAIKTCQELVRLYPDTTLADRAFLEIGKARSAEKTDESMSHAINVFQAIVRMPNSPLKAEAQFRIGETIEERIRSAAARSRSSRRADYSPAMIAYRTCAETYPSSSFAGESFKKVIDYYISMRDYSRAEETLERVFQDYLDAPWLDEMLLKWGVVCHRQGKREEAKEKFGRILSEYPGGPSAAKAALFLKKLEQ